MPQLTFKRNAHVSYFKRCLTLLPSSAEAHDGNRITIAYFCLSALDLLGALNSSFTVEERRKWVGWVWALQATNGGFRGSTFMTPSHPRGDHEPTQSITDANPGHLPSTYTALLILGILRAPVEEWINKLDIAGLEHFLAACADSNGSFSPIPLPVSDPTTSATPDSASSLPPSPPFQSDARMAYCASVVDNMVKLAKYPSLAPPRLAARAPRDRREAAGRADIRASSVGTVMSVEPLLQAPSRRPLDRTRKWLADCQTWEGGFGQHPGLEAQGGTTYCAIASLYLTNPTSAEQWSSGFDVDAATRYLVSRQLDGSQQTVNDSDVPEMTGYGGFQGRPGKDEDVCYSFWCGGAMRILRGKALFDTDANTRALLDSQSPIGGFGKSKGDFPDPYHSYLATAALAMNEQDPRPEERSESPGEGELEAGEGGTVRASPTPVPRLGLKALDPLWNVSLETRAYIEDCLQSISRRKYAGQGSTE